MPAKETEMDRISDAVDAVNIYLGSHREVSIPKEKDDIATQQSVDKENFRNYVDAAESVKAFYREQHTKQTVAFNLAARKRFLKNHHAQMTVWEAIEMLNTLVDESDPDTSLSQIQHLLQTAEAMRKDGRPGWMQLTGLLHDLGKLLCFFGSDGQWDVVGDTFIVGAQFSDQIIYSDTFANNPDASDPVYSSKLGIYKANCGLDNVMFSWGHDEYLYWRMKEQSKIPQAGLDMIRLHSCYPLHRQGAYREFFAPGDEDKIKHVLDFNKYDLYSKSDAPPDPVALRPYYEQLIDEYIIGGRDAILNW